MDLSPNTAGGGRGVKMLSMVLKLVFECIGSRLPMFYGGGTERVKLLCAEKLVWEGACHDGHTKCRPRALLRRTWMNCCFGIQQVLD